MQTLVELAARGEDDAIALAAPGRAPLTFAALRRQIARVGAALAGAGVQSSDRVALVLPNGPTAASAFLSVAAHAAAAPLNPAYKADEFAFYLSDLRAKLLLVPTGTESPALEVAARLGVRVVRLQEEGAAGEFTVDLPAGKADSRARPEDVALVLHTSGTTSRPKIVPLTHANLCASARNIARTLELTAGDRCLNVMPLFHIHGLVGVVLSSLGAGASVWCSPGFNALQFFGWLEEARPTWYSAVPTMHQAILARGQRNADAAKAAGLRFIRSSSASLPPAVMQQVEALFGAPVIESYGMTEAAHQMASNPLPPRARKPGSVGIAAGPEVAVLHPDRSFCAPGETGEVVIRGENVTRGYENNPSANADAFVDGWFRTGDQGVLDGDGYLTITGRLKEIINRGGEKISPREVDEVLLAHPAVAQAVTFALPHEKLGEDVAAAVVLREGAQLTEREVRDFAAGRLADFKVPRKVLFLAEIPKGPTGKLQRIGLARTLGLVP